MPLEADYSIDKYISGVSTFEGYFSFQFIFNDGTRSKCSESSITRAADQTTLVPEDKKEWFDTMIPEGTQIS